jgi:hypothetical protein
VHAFMVKSNDTRSTSIFCASFTIFIYVNKFIINRRHDLREMKECLMVPEDGISS